MSMKKSFNQSNLVAVFPFLLTFLLSCMTVTISSSHAPLPTSYYYGSISSSSPSSSSQLSQSTSPTSSMSTGGQQPGGRSLSSYLFPSSSQSSFLASLSSSKPQNTPSNSPITSSFPDRPNRSRYPRIPSCSQLREMWMKSISASYNNHWSNNGQVGKFGMIQTNEIPKLHPQNPYYYNLLSSREEPAFGDIKYTKEENGSQEKSESVPSSKDEVFGKEISKGVSGQQEEEEVYGTIGKTGTFHERPASESELGPVFGHVVVGPDGGPSLAGTFGSFSSPPVEQSRNRQSSSQVSSSNSRERTSGVRSSGRRKGTSASGASDPKSDTSSRRTSKSSTGSSSPRRPGQSMTANDFFNANWHDKPVVVGLSGV